MNMFEFLFVIFAILSTILTAVFIVLLLYFRKKIMGWVKYRLSPNDFLISNIIKDNGRIEVNYVEVNKRGTFILKDAEYIIDPKCLIFYKNKAMIFHFNNVPNPIDFYKKEYDIEINAENFYRLQKDKLLKDYLMENKILLFVLILSAINLLISLGICAKIFGLIDKVAKKGA